LKYEANEANQAKESLKFMVAELKVEL